MPITEKMLVDTLRRALPRGSVDIILRDGSTPVGVMPDGSEVDLVFRWAGAGFPRDIARALGSDPLSAPTHADVARHQHEIIFAQSVSDGSRRVIEAVGASWVALDGSASLHIGTVWVERSVDPGRHPDEVGFRWSTARADIAEALFAVMVHREQQNDGLRRVPEVGTLATLAGRSLGSVANALSDFDQSEWTVPGPEPRSRVLANGSGILDSWSEWSRRQPRHWSSFHTLDRDHERIERVLLATFGADLILSGPSAGERIQPFLTGAMAVSAYVADADPHRIRDLAERAGMLPADTGQVRLAVAPPTVANTTQIIGGIRTASAARVFADLLTGSERERESAEAVRDAALRSLS